MFASPKSFIGQAWVNFLCQVIPKSEGDSVGTKAVSQGVGTPTLLRQSECEMQDILRLGIIISEGENAISSPHHILRNFLLPGLLSQCPNLGSLFVCSTPSLHTVCILTLLLYPSASLPTHLDVPSCPSLEGRASKNGDLAGRQGVERGSGGREYQQADLPTNNPEQAQLATAPRASSLQL